MDKAAKRKGWKLRDPKGQMLGVLSIAYVVVGILYAFWVLNSGISLCWKAKLMLCTKQLADLEAIIMYEGLYRGMGAAFLFPGASATAVRAAPSFFSATGLNGAAITGESQPLPFFNVAAQVNMTPNLFGGWSLPSGAQLYQFSTKTIPVVIAY